MSGCNVGCEARIWDNGDMDDCGKPVLRNGFCKIHLKEAVSKQRETIKRLKIELAGARSYLKELTK